jgi:hypothetical protein
MDFLSSLTKEYGFKLILVKFGVLHELISNSFSAAAVLYCGNNRALFVAMLPESESIPH